MCGVLLFACEIFNSCFYVPKSYAVISVLDGHEYIKIDHNYFLDSFILTLHTGNLIPTSGQQADHFSEGFVFDCTNKVYLK
jgi:hypothetical protein